MNPFTPLIVGCKVRVLPGASAWMKCRSYWLSEWPASIDGQELVVLHDYTHLPNDAAHWWCENGTVKDCGVHPQWLEVVALPTSDPRDARIAELERDLNAANAQIGLLIAGSKQQERQIEFLNGRVKELEAVVNDPEALWSNWLRGTVKLPAGIGDVRKHQEHIAELENRLCAKFNKSEEDSKHYQERIERLVEAGDNVAKIIGPPGSNFWAEVPEIDRAYLAWTKAKEGL